MVRALRIGAGFGLAFLVLTCTDKRVAGPTRPTGVSLDLQAFAASPAPGASDVLIDSLRVALRRGDNSFAVDLSFRTPSR